MLLNTLVVLESTAFPNQQQPVIPFLRYLSNLATESFIISRIEQSSLDISINEEDFVCCFDLAGLLLNFCYCSYIYDWLLIVYS